MKTASGELGASGETKPRTRGPWPLSRWLLLILLVLAAHVALIFIFGTRKPITPMAVKNAPKLELAAGSSEWLMLNDPTLFALPNIEGFAGPAWLEPPHVQFHRRNGPNRRAGCSFPAGNWAPFSASSWRQTVLPPLSLS